MRLHRFAALMLALATASACQPSERAPASAVASSALATRPNIVFLLADDLGWKDVGFHESEIETPNIDRLAASGVRLEALYALPVCTPTRAALMTGRYPIRYGLQGDVIRLGDRFGLPLDERTLADALSAAGYATAMSGKWHLGDFEDAYKPTHRGFDHQYGHYAGEIDYYTHARSDGIPDWQRDDEPIEENGYSTTLIAEDAVRRIAKRDSTRPFFLYVAFNAPHRPLQAPKRYFDRYAHIAGTARRWKAAATTALDDAIGRIVAAIEQHGLMESTLIVFASDNGGIQGRTMESDNSPLRGGKGTVYEGGVRVAACAAWPGKLGPGGIVNEPVHMVDWYPTFLQLAGAAPATPKPLDGRDIWPTLSAGAPSPHAEILINAAVERSALRRGAWKLVVERKAGLESVELFDLAHDPGETSNLAEKESVRTRELLERLTEYDVASVPALSPN